MFDIRRLQDSPETLLRRAELALSLAKIHGESQFRIESLEELVADCNEEIRLDAMLPSTN